jgi:hypothetical protein
VGGGLVGVVIYSWVVRECRELRGVVFDCALRMDMLDQRGEGRGCEGPAAPQRK